MAASQHAAHLLCHSNNKMTLEWKHQAEVAKPGYSYHVLAVCLLQC